jgi:hypothetical protein
MLHCCGGVAELIPAMIEIGLDGLHAVQPCCRGMDLRLLKTRFGDKMLFNGAIDSHHVLIKGDPNAVREKTREVLETMKPGGGYVAGASHDTILEETPVENVVAMFDAVAEFGAYPIICVYTQVQCRVPEEKRPEMADFLNHVNSNNWYGNFEMDMDDGGVRYRTSLNLADGVPTTHMLGTLLYGNFNNVNRYLPGIMSLIWNDVVAEDAIGFCEDLDADTDEEAA